MSNVLRFIAAITLLGALASLMTSGAHIPVWLAATLLLGGIFGLLYRGNLTRKLIALLSGLVLLSVFWRSAGPGALGIIGIVALIFLAMWKLMSPFLRDRW